MTVRVQLPPVLRTVCGGARHARCRWQFYRRGSFRSFEASPFAGPPPVRRTGRYPPQHRVPARRPDDPREGSQRAAHQAGRGDRADQRAGGGMNADSITRSFEIAAERCDDITPLVYEKLFARYPEMETLFSSNKGVRGEMLARVIDIIFDFLGSRGYSSNMIQCARSSQQEGYGVARRNFRHFLRHDRRNSERYCRRGLVAGNERELVRFARRTLPIRSEFRSDGTSYNLKHLYLQRPQALALELFFLCSYLNAMTTISGHHRRSEAAQGTRGGFERFGPLREGDACSGR